MIIQHELLPYFWGWLSTNVGIEPIIHDPPKDEEFGRFMWGGDFVVVRAFGMASDSKSGSTIQVHTSVPEILEEIERSWGHYWDTVTANITKETENGESEESGHDSPIRTNPITKEEFRDKEQYVESLCREYKSAKAIIFAASLNADEVLACLEEEAYLKNPIQVGTVVVEGIKLNAKVKFNENVVYAKSRGDDHPLLKIVRVHDDLGVMVRIEYKEKGRAIGDLINRYKSDTLLKTDNAEVAEALVEVRTTKKGKSSIEIKERVDGQANEGKEGPVGESSPMY